MASFIPYLADYKNKSDGMHTVFIRVTTYYEVKKISTDIRIQKSDWNPKKKEIRTSHFHYAQFNETINSIIQDLQRIYTEAKARGVELKATEIGIIYDEQKFKGTAPSNQPGFFSFCYEYIDMLRLAGKFNTERSLKSIYGKFHRWIDKKEIAFDDITPALLDQYKLFLRSQKNNAKSTIHVNLKRIREAFNRANRNGIYKGNPFDQMGQMEKGKTKKIILNREEVMNIEVYEPRPASNTWHVRNFWLLSFYCGGIRFSDVCTLMWGMISNQRLRYNMGKSELFRDFKLAGRAQKILWEYYPDPANGFMALPINEDAFARKEKSDLIFPILSDKWRAILRPYEKQIASKGIIVLPAEIHYNLKRHIATRNVIINKHLKGLAYVCDVQKQLSFHGSRHAFADIARKKDISIQLISELLGHSKITTTQEYFGSGFDSDELDAAMDEIIND